MCRMACHTTLRVRLIDPLRVLLHSLAFRIINVLTVNESVLICMQLFFKFSRMEENHGAKRVLRFGSVACQASYSVPQEQ